MKNRDATTNLLRSKDEKVIKVLLEAMCVSASRDIDVFQHAKERYQKVRNASHLKKDERDKDWSLDDRLKEARAMIKMLSLLKANIEILTKSPL